MVVRARTKNEVIDDEVSHTRSQLRISQRAIEAIACEFCPLDPRQYAPKGRRHRLGMPSRNTETGLTTAVIDECRAPLSFKLARWASGKMRYQRPKVRFQAHHISVKGLVSQRKHRTTEPPSLIRPSPKEGRQNGDGVPIHVSNQGSTPYSSPEQRMLSAMSRTAITDTISIETTAARRG